MPRDIEMPGTVFGRTPLPNCTSIKDYHPHLNLVDLYRLYYMIDKSHMLSWKNREEPWFMGDRFYQQQKQYLGTCPGDKTPGRRKAPGAPKKLTKAEIAEKLGIPGVEKLLVVDLQKLTDVKSVSNLSMPEGRLKKPYIEVCSMIHNEVDWSKLTVANLKEVISHFLGK